MNMDCGIASSQFLEIASEQRLSILLRLLEQKTRVSSVAKELDATVPEVFRNFERLAKVGLITKEADGDYSITPYGKIMCTQVHALQFMLQNKAYFKTHQFGDLPEKFLHRIGALASGIHVKGFVRVMEQWSEIYSTADKYLYNILFEVPYSKELVEPLAKKLSDNVKVKSIFSFSAITPKERKKVIDSYGFKKFIDDGLLERKMKEDVSVLLVLNEKKAAVMFPTTSGEVDMSEMFYSTEPEFHEWCLDYFKHCWESSSLFQESKIKP